MALDKNDSKIKNGETHDGQMMSLDEFEHKYEQALLEWERITTMKKEVTLPVKRRRHLPKRLPKMGILNDGEDCELSGQALREQLVQVLGKSRTEEAMVRALERTLESQNRKLESEKKQQHQLNQQLQKLLQEKEDLEKMTHTAKVHFQKVASVVENVERRLEENAERLRKIDDEVLKIRRDAVELLQMYQKRKEVEGQVEGLSSSITALQEQKAAALERMRHSQEEEANLYHSMKASVRKVCVQQSENILELDRGYEVLWSNVDHLLDHCDKILELTRPEVEALRAETHHQTIKSKGPQLNTKHTLPDTKENNLNDTSTIVHPNVELNDSQTAQQDMANNESDSPRADGEAKLICVDTGVGVPCEPSTTEESPGDNLTAHEQIPESARGQLNLSLQSGTVSELETPSDPGMFARKPLIVLTQDKEVELSGNSSPVFKIVLQSTDTTIHNDQTMNNKTLGSQDYQNATSSSLSVDVSMPNKSFSSPSSLPHKLSGCHIESVTVNEATFPSLHHTESKEDTDAALAIDVADEEEIDVCTHETEQSVFGSELNCSITAAEGSPPGGCLPQNIIIVLTEGKDSHAFTEPDILNKPITASQT